MPCEPRKCCWQPTIQRPPSDVPTIACCTRAQALLREQDIRFRKHSSVHGAFGQHFAKSALIDPKFHRWLLDSYDDRIRGDYDTECVIEEESASLRIEQAKEFLQSARKWLEVQK